MATRIIRAYRTVSHDVAVTIAGMTPLSIQAKIEADIFALQKRMESQLPRRTRCRSGETPCNLHEGRGYEDWKMAARRDRPLERLLHTGSNGRLMGRES